MRQFIDIVTEGEKSGSYLDGGPLYHGTSPLGLAHILSEGFVYMGSDDVWGNERGVSLTTDLPTARFFSERAAEPLYLDAR